MHIPIEAIKKAIEGGYEINFGDTDIALDPQFWQSLGKALDWPIKWGSCEACFLTGLGKRSPDCTCSLRSWKDNADKFLSIILTNGDTEKFWSDLLLPAQGDNN